MQRLAHIVPAALLAVCAGVAGFALATSREGTDAAAHRDSSSAGTAGQGLSHAYAAALGEAMSQLDRARVAPEAQLAHARTAGTQARAAQELARGQMRAATAVGGIVTGPGERAANAAITAALARAGRGYAGMAATARSGDRRGYDRERRAISTAAGALASAFEQLRRLGYRVGD